MNPSTFSTAEQDALRECVAALRALPYYESSEFEAIFGNSKEEVEDVYAAFPDWDIYDEAAEGYDASGDIIRNALAWLMNGKEEEKKAMRAHLSIDSSALEGLYAKVFKL